MLFATDGGLFHLIIIVCRGSLRGNAENFSRLEVFFDARTNAVCLRVRQCSVESPSYVANSTLSDSIGTQCLSVYSNLYNYTTGFATSTLHISYFSACILFLYPLVLSLYASAEIPVILEHLRIYKNVRIAWDPRPWLFPARLYVGGYWLCWSGHHVPSPWCIYLKPCNHDLSARPWRLNSDNHFGLYDLLHKQIEKICDLRSGTIIIH